MEKNDPLVQKIAEEACLDPKYVEMMNYLETDTKYDDIDPECELKQMKDIMSRLSIVTLDGYRTLGWFKIQLFQKIIAALPS